MKKLIKRRVADLLDRSVNSLPIIHRRVSCILFGVLMGIVCLAQVITAITEKNGRTHFNIQSISVPKGSFNRDRGENSGADKLRTLLDSLKDTSIYDSLRMTHPGLIDSANRLLQNN